MSTIDPIAARRAKRLERAGQRGYLIGAIVAVVALVVAAVCLGAAIGWLVEMLRSGVVDSIFADNAPGVGGFLGMATFPALMVTGTFGLIMAAATARHLIDAYRGGEKQPMVQTPIMLWAVATGLTLDSLTWTEPVAVGKKVDPVFHEDRDWSVFGWVMYYADIWMPALAIVIAALTTLYAVKHNRRLRQQIADRDRLLAEGRQVTGQITDLTIRTSQNDQGQRSVVGADVVVKFTDLHGTDRWVTRKVVGRSGIPPADTALVLFDPLHPEVEDLIFVAFLPDPLPGDWVGTVA